MADTHLNITTAGNTYNPILLAIQTKNYKITLSFTVDEDGHETSHYDAEKDNRRFSARSPAELLGLIAMWEVRGDNWHHNRRTEPDLHGELAELSVTYNQDGNVIEC